MSGNPSDRGVEETLDLRPGIQLRPVGVDPTLRKDGSGVVRERGQRDAKGEPVSDHIQGRKNIATRSSKSKITVRFAR